MKQGDLALIVDCRWPEHIGKCVTLVERIERDHVFRFHGKLFRTLDNSWIVSGNVDHKCTDGTVIDGVLLIAEHKLIPLRGDDVQLQTESKEESMFEETTSH